MKKYTFFFVILAFILAALACNLPNQNPALEVPAVTEPVDGFRLETLVEQETIVSIIVPDAYFVEGAGYDFLGLIGNLDEVSGGLSLDVQSLLQGAQDDIILWGYDAGSGVEIPTSFVVLKNTEFAAMPLGVLSTFAGTLLGNEVQIIDQNRFNIGGRDTLRWITVTNQTGIELTQAVYIFKDSGALYLVGFNGDRQGIFGQLPVFDQIVASLTLEHLN